MYINGVVVRNQSNAWKRETTKQEHLIFFQRFHLNGNIVILMKFSSLATLEISSAASDENDNFQCS